MGVEQVGGMMGSVSEDLGLLKSAVVPSEEVQGKGLCDQTCLFLRLTTSLSTPAEMETGSPGQVRLSATVGYPADGCWDPALGPLASGSPQPGLEGKADKQQTNLKQGLSQVCTVEA